MKYEVPIWEKANLTLEEAAAYFGIGINKIRQLTNEKKLPVCTVVRQQKTHQAKGYGGLSFKRIFHIAGASPWANAGQREHLGV